MRSRVDNLKLNSIVCLTEESVETLYLLEKESLIKGVSVYTKRPKEARSLPRVSAFLKSNYKKIEEIDPDLIIGFSDIQKDIARDLVEKGFNVFISNQRSISDILKYIYQLALLVDAKPEGQKLVNSLLSKIEKIRQKNTGTKKFPKVYFEEWDEPMISGIRWVSELISIAGGVDIFSEKSKGVLAKERFVNSSDVVDRAPDIILACWCGKKVDLNSIYKRQGWESVPAIQNKRVYELEPEIFLQPGPAPILEGLDILSEIFACGD